MPSQQQRMLILCKTYPSPSAKHAETSCVAAMNEDGSLIRLYPVPFRLISDEKQFKKWQWISARVERSRKDHRPESHRIFVDTITCDPEPLSTDNNWHARRLWIERAPIFEDFAALDAARRRDGVTLGIVRPSAILGLEITPVERPDWTDDEKAKLIQLQQQGDLFDDMDAKSITTLRKLPFDFHYRYRCRGVDGPQEYRHKIVDWEAGALFWNVFRSHSERWEELFRDKLLGELPDRDLMFLMGTIHRFPDQWLIVSLIYPPKQRPAQSSQGSLF